jgi:hypothetical protein
MTSGGTESILSAIKASRDYMVATKGIREPEMIIGISAHAAYWKVRRIRYGHTGLSSPCTGPYQVREGPVAFVRHTIGNAGSACEHHLQAGLAVLNLSEARFDHTNRLSAGC